MGCGREDPSDSATATGRLERSILDADTPIVRETELTDMTLDLLVVDAVVVDGTGRDRFEGVVGIDGDEIAVVEADPDARPEADAVIDVGGHVVAPGFVDIQSFADLEVFVSPDRPGKIRQGVTTELVGSSGYSAAPLWYKSDDRHGWRLSDEDWRTLLSTQLGRADDAWNWGSVGDYLDAVAETSVATNVGTMVGHGTLQHNVTGFRELPPTGDELEEMADLLEMGFIDGAVGFSTAPSLVEDTVDPVLQAFVDRAGNRDRPVAVSARERDDGTLSRVFDAAGDAGVSVHLGALAVEAARRPADPGDLLARASDAGLDPTGDVTPYDTETVMLVSLLPREVLDESGETFQAALEDADVRDRLRDDLPTAVDWSRVRVTEPSDATGRTVAELASDRETTVADLVCDLLADDLETTVTVPTAGRDTLDRSVADERITVATGGALASTRAGRAHGTFAAFLSTGRRRADIGLEEAVRRVTSLPARTFGLDGKGTVTPGADADLVVFDPDEVADRTTTEPRRPPAGVETVLVGGTRALDEGELTGERPGEPIRVASDG